MATKARILEKEDGRIDWSLSATAIACRLRGFFPWPGAFTQLEGRGVKVLRARVEGDLRSGPPGTVTGLDREGIVVACGAATQLRLLEVQPESRNPVPASAFALGARLQLGARFG